MLNQVLVCFLFFHKYKHTSYKYRFITGVVWVAQNNKSVIDTMDKLMKSWKVNAISTFTFLPDILNSLISNF